MFGILIVGMSTGKPETLLYGTDYNGDACADKMTYFPRMNQDIIEATKKNANLMKTDFYGICSEQCPEMGTYICTYEKQKAFDNAGLKGAALKQAQKAATDPWFSNGPCWHVDFASSTVMFRCFPKKNESSVQTQVCVDQETGFSYSPSSPTECNPSGAVSPIFVNGITVAPGKCAHYDVKTKNSVTTYTPNENCRTTETTTLTVARGATADNPLIDQLQETAAIVGAFAGDLEKTIVEIMMIGGALALVLGVVWLLLLKYCASCIVWTTLSAVVGSMAAASLYCSYLGGMLGTQFQVVLSKYEIIDPGVIAAQNQKQRNQAEYEILAYLLWIATFILLVIVIFLRTKVKITIGIIREASRSLQAMPLLIVWPFLPFIFAILLFVYFCGVSALVYSAGHVSLSDLGSITGNITGYSVNVTDLTMSEFVPNNAKEVMLWYHLFGFLWFNSLINAVSMCTVAGAVSAYYWSRTKKTGALVEGHMGKRPIGTALYCCFRYHFGSLAFGSMIVAIVQFIRAVLMYIDYQTKNLQKSNILIKIFMKVVQCCMWCLEKVVKYVSKNAYILVAMRGKSFCASTFNAFGIIFSNLSQVGLLAATTNILLLLVRVTISVGCGFLMLALVDTPAYNAGGDKELTAPLLPVVVVFFLAYTVASIFMNAYGLAIDTILLCFCEDKKANKPGEYFMSEELQKCIPGFKKGNVQKKKEKEDDGSSSSDDES